MKRWAAIGGCLGVLALCLAGTGCATVQNREEINLLPALDRTENVPAAVEGPPPTVGHRVLYYVPNRLLDLCDVFRARVRVGPGWAAGLRITDYGSVFAGSYRSYYAGLPGPRYPYKWRSPVGREEWRGLVLAGVDATDDTAYGPRYSPTEIGASVHLGLVGADLDLDPVDFWDLLAGVIFFDPGGDDL